MSYRRPDLPARAPKRSLEGYFRRADGASGAGEDAVVAAVRAGYRIVDAQIEQGLRIAEGLRGAADAKLTSAESLARRGVALVIEAIDTLTKQPQARRLLPLARSTPTSAAPPPLIVLDGMRCALELAKWRLDRDLVAPEPLSFTRRGDEASIAGRIERRAHDGAVVLTLHLSALPAAGRWSAPICNAQRELLGLVAIEVL